jgi:hypothetical protein
MKLEVGKQKTMWGFDHLECILNIQIEFWCVIYDPLICCDCLFIHFFQFTILNFEVVLSFFQWKKVLGKLATTLKWAYTQYVSTIQKKRKDSWSFVGLLFTNNIATWNKFKWENWIVQFNIIHVTMASFHIHM